VDGDKASAISESGILKISVPKKQVVSSKTIKIEKK
jgi:HSP20 family molecular chaperone IbpA